MSIIVCNCQHCDKQQFQTLSFVHYTISSVVMSNLFIRVDRILALKKKLRVRLAYILLTLFTKLLWHGDKVKTNVALCLLYFNI